MKIGKISESVLKRTIIKEIKYKNKYVKKGAAIGNDATVLNLGGKEMVTSMATYSGQLLLSAKRSFASAINSVSAKRAVPVAVNVSFWLPEAVKESRLREAIVWMVEEGQRYGIQVSGGHTETDGKTEVPVVTVSAFGYLEGTYEEERERVKPGMDIVMVGETGIEGTAVLAIEKNEELLNRFTERYVDVGKKYSDELVVASEAAVAIQHGERAMHDVSKSGVFGALWELGEYLKLGVDVDLKSIPVRQETIELCEYFDLNPYLLCGSGALLIVTENGKTLADKYTQKGRRAAVIGHITQGHDRIVRNGDEKRFLEAPKSGKKECI